LIAQDIGTQKVLQWKFFESSDTVIMKTLRKFQYLARKQSYKSKKCLLLLPDGAMLIAFYKEQMLVNISILQIYINLNKITQCNKIIIFPLSIFYKIHQFAFH